MASHISSALEPGGYCVGKVSTKMGCSLPQKVLDVTALLLQVRSVDQLVSGVGDFGRPFLRYCGC